MTTELLSMMTEESFLSDRLVFPLLFAQNKDISWLLPYFMLLFKGIVAEVRE